MSEKSTKLAKPKRGRRVISFDESELERLKHYAGLGLNQQELAEVMGISLSTLRRRKKDSELFEQHMREGRTKAVSDVANALYINATQENNIQAQIFFLKNRAESGQWVDRQETVNASINLNDVISGAKTRIGNYTTTERQPKIIDVVDTSSQGGEHLVSKKLHNKKKG
jgi:predicted DNA-binding protein (UPF0251 family)